MATDKTVTDEVTVNLNDLDGAAKLLMLAFAGREDDVITEFSNWRKSVEALDEQAKAAKAAYSATRKMIVTSKSSLANRIHDFYEGRGRPAGSKNETK